MFGLYFLHCALQDVIEPEEYTLISAVEVAFDSRYGQLRLEVDGIYFKASYPPEYLQEIWDLPSEGG